MQAFEWDEDKRRSNIDKHGVDFLGVRQLFDGRLIVGYRSDRDGKQRIATTDILDGKFFTVIRTYLNVTIRLISARRARNAEERANRAIHG